MYIDHQPCMLGRAMMQMAAAVPVRTMQTSHMTGRSCSCSSGVRPASQCTRTQRQMARHRCLAAPSAAAQQCQGGLPAGTPIGWQQVLGAQHGCSHRLGSGAEGSRAGCRLGRRALSPTAGAPGGRLHSRLLCRCAAPAHLQQCSGIDRVAPDKAGRCSCTVVPLQLGPCLP